MFNIVFKGEKLLKSLNREWCSKYPFLYLGFFNLKGNPQSSWAIEHTKVRFNQIDESFTITGDMKVADFETKYRDAFGTKIDIKYSIQGRLSRSSKEMNLLTIDELNDWVQKNGGDEILNTYPKWFEGAESNDAPIENPISVVENWDLNNDQVLVVAGDWAFNIADKYEIYECQNKRSFRPSRYIAFYKNGQIDVLFEITQKPYDFGDSTNTPQMEQIKKDFPDYDDQSPRRIMVLKRLQNIGPIVNDGKSKSGKTVPFTYGQPRYTTYDLITRAKKTSELINGLDANIITDHFVNNIEQYDSKVDMLWVVDNSGSMDAYQQSLGKNFQSFINTFVVQKPHEIPDFKMAVTTTDEQSNGAFHYKDLYVDLNKSNAINALMQQKLIDSFTKSVKVGTSGSATEKGLRCAWLAVRNNAQYFRADAPLVINIVTDEEDDDSTMVDEYLQKLRSLKSGQRLIINVIAKTGFLRYEYAVNQTKGIYLNIQDDFSKVLKGISTQMMEVAHSYPLSQTPVDPSKIIVRVDGVTIKDYAYDANKNLLKPGASIPDGANVEVEYEAAEVAFSLEG